MENVNTIGKDFTLGQLAKFVAPPVITRLVVSVFQTLDDSLFISRYCGQNALAAFSVMLPWFMLVDAIGMLCSAVSTRCSILMGKKENDRAKKDFSAMVVIIFGLGLCITLFLSFFRDKLLTILGETEALRPYAETYINVSRFYAPFSLSTYVLGSFYVIAGKPKCSMYTSIIQTFCNIFFDWVFIVKLNTGIVGAAYANFIGFACVWLFGIIFFSSNKREIHFVKPDFKLKPLFKDVIKLGRTQVITSLSISLNTYITNNVQLALAGEELVAAFTIVNNVQFMFMNSMFGLIGSICPIISYAYGEKNAKKLRKTLKQAMILVLALVTIIALVYFFGRETIINLYLNEEASNVIREMARYGMKVAPLSFYFFGFNVLTQEFFNSVANAKVSSTLTIIENIIFSNITVLLMPQLLGLNSIWYIFAVTEVCTFFFSMSCLEKNKDRYGFGKEKIATFINE